MQDHGVRSGRTLLWSGEYECCAALECLAVTIVAAAIEVGGLKEAGGAKEEGGECIDAMQPHGKTRLSKNKADCMCAGTCTRTCVPELSTRG